MPSLLLHLAPIARSTPSAERTGPALSGASIPLSAPWVDHEGFSVYTFASELAGEGALAIDLDGKSVWVGTSAGLLEHDLLTNRWTHHLPPFSRGKFGVSSIVATEDGRPAVDVLEYLEKKNHVRGRGAYWFDARTATWKRLPGGVSGGQVRHWDGSKLWVSVGGELHGLTGDSEIWRAIGRADNPSWKNGSITRVDSRVGELWTAATGSQDYETGEWTGGGVSRFSLKTNQWVHYSVEDGVVHRYCSDVAVGRDEVWVAHWEEERGLSRYDRRTDRWEKVGRSANGLETGGVELALDGDVLWIGQQGGLVRLDTRTRKATEWKEMDGLPGYIVSDLVVGPKHLWAAVYGYGSGDARYRTAGVVRFPR